MAQTITCDCCGEGKEQFESVEQVGRLLHVLFGQQPGDALPDICSDCWQMVKVVVEHILHPHQGKPTRDLHTQMRSASDALLEAESNRLATEFLRKEETLNAIIFERDRHIEALKSGKEAEG